MFLFEMDALKMFDRSRIFWCMLSDRWWIGEGVGWFFIMLTRYWAEQISIYVADRCGIGT